MALFFLLGQNSYRDLTECMETKNCSLRGSSSSFNQISTNYRQKTYKCNGNVELANRCLACSIFCLRWHGKIKSNQQQFIFK